MPYHVEHDTEVCPMERPFAVKKTADGKVMGCHPTEKDAQEQLAALYANEKRNAQMEYKSFKLEVKELGDEDGSFSGYCSVFGNVDLQNEVVEKGAFKRTLDHSGGRVPLLWQHNLKEPIGVSMEMAEDERGLRVKGQLNLETQRGREAYALLKQGALRGLSVGYQVVNDIWQKGVRHLRELKLYEYSLVTVAANPEALIENFKAAESGEVCPVCGIALEEKAGRVLSRSTRENITKVLEHLQLLLDTADAPSDPVVEDHSEEPEAEPEPEPSEEADDSDAEPVTADKALDPEAIHSLAILFKDIRVKSKGFRIPVS